MNYEECQKQSDFEKGDSVKLLRHPQSYECGWGLHWETEFCKNFPIGEKYDIKEIDGKNGVRIQRSGTWNDAYVPYFCLELIERPYNLSRPVYEGQVWGIPDTGKYIVAMVGYENHSTIYRLVGVQSGNRLADEYNSLSKIEDLLIKWRATYLGEISDFIK